MGFGERRQVVERMNAILALVRRWGGGTVGLWDGELASWWGGGGMVGK